MNTVTSDRTWSYAGTFLFHATLIFLLFLMKCGGGGGGNGGLGYTGLMSMDVAAIGNDVDGWGPTEDAQTAETEPVTTQPQEETPSITDDNAVEEAPSVDPNKAPTKPRPNTKPVTKPIKPEPKPEVSKGLQGALGGMKGNGTTTGSGNQGASDGQIGGKGVMNGGGSQGTGGGQGGGNGTGTGTGTGPGSGPGSGGMNYDYKLTGRTISRKPSISETAPDEGVVVVDIWVDKNGKVTKAEANAALSNTANAKLFKLAEKAAKNAEFSSNPSATTDQKGTIKITFKLH